MTVLVNDECFQRIASAIRQKNGEGTLYRPSDMADAILNIPSGGGIDVNYEYKNASLRGIFSNTSQFNDFIENLPGYSNEYYDLSNLYNPQYSYLSPSPTSLNIGQSYGSLKVYSLKKLVSNDYYVTSVTFRNLDTSECVDMSFLLSELSQLTTISGLEYFDVSKVEDMSGMFYSLQSLASLDLSSFYTANVKDMSAMFMNDFKLNSLDLSGNFNTSNVLSFANMFNSINSSNYNNPMTEIVGLGNFSTGRCIYFNKMFENANIVKIDLNNFIIRMDAKIDNMLNGFQGTRITLPFEINLFTQSVNFFGSNGAPNLEHLFFYGSDFSSIDDDAELVLSKIWMNGSASDIAAFEEFAQELGTCKSDYTRNIRINTTLYNQLTAGQKALVTDKGWGLTYSL